MTLLANLHKFVCLAEGLFSESAQKGYSHRGAGIPFLRLKQFLRLSDLFIHKLTVENSVDNNACYIRKIVLSVL